MNANAIVTEKLQLKGYDYKNYEDYSVSSAGGTLFPQTETGRLEVNYEDGRKGLNKLFQFHMHAPSEHTVEGKNYPLELHIIHTDAETGRFGTVIGIFFEISKDPNFNNFYFDKIQPEQAAK